MKFLKSLVWSVVLGLNCNCSSKAPQYFENTLPAKNEVKKTELSIMSYNIHHCSPVDNPGLIDVSAIAKIIKNSGVELAGLQEVDVNNRRSGINLDQAAKLGELTGMYFYFSKSIDYNGGSYGTAILSKYAISVKQTIRLPMAEGTEQRTLSVVTVTLPDGKNICMANTHLDYSSDANALAQVKIIAETLKEVKDPVFITGDFNMVQNSNTIRYLNQHYSSTCEGSCPATFPSDYPKNAIDFIFYSKPQKMQVYLHEVLNEPIASDHRPVIAKLAW